MYHYRIHGLDVASDLALPDARSATDNQANVRITAGTVAPCACDTVELHGDAVRATLFLPAAATFEFDRGAHIAVTPHSDDPDVVRTFLLGSAWAVLLHQRGVLPLHGCALEWNGRAHLFVGEQKAGKSTLAAALVRAGAKLVSDDITAIDLSDAPRVWPGLRSMKLAAADPMLGETLGPTAAEGKLRIVPRRLAGDAPLPLAAIVELARAPATATPALTRLRGSTAGGVAIRHTFRGLATARLGRSAPHLAACAALAASTPVYRLDRAWNLDSVVATAAWLMAEAALS